MKWMQVCLVLVAIFAGKTLAESCQTCRGVACQAKEIAEKDCDEYVTALPFESQLMFNGIDDNAQYGCLNVQYYVGKSLEHIRQCVLSSDLDTYCSTLKTVVAVKSCNMESALEEREKRNVAVETEEEDDDGKNTTDDPITTTTDNAVAQFLSISCVVAALLSKLF
ncbi:uncharacterized protein [Euwallacea similis]|uniref:uncharacterized protein n=1 Tax=Euwallacea similis TaxID=1736056 RepID=UPI00344F86C6